MTITCEGTRTGADAMNGGKQVEKWARKLVGSMLTFDPKEEKDMYKKTRK